MGNRRFAQVSTSDEEDDAPPKLRSSPETLPKQRKRKQRRLLEEEEEEEEVVEEEKSKKKKEEKEEASQSEEEEEEEPTQEDAKPVGDPVKVTGKGKNRRTHYEAFEFDGNHYDLEDPVLIVPEDSKIKKPYVAIIKDIAQDKKGSIMITGQWFYRPEEAGKKGGGSWQSNDTRELFYSFHRDDVPAESIMHRCVVHFIPLHKQLPKRKQYPGFIVRKVYDAVERKLWKLTDKDYEDSKQHEIDLLVQKTMKRMVDLPDIEPEDNPPAEQEDQLKAKRSLRRKNISPLDVSREEEATRLDDKSETPGSCPSNASEEYNILANFKVLTGDTLRDKWMERILQGVKYVCSSADSINQNDKEKIAADGAKTESEMMCPETSDECQDKSLKNDKSFVWPDDAISAVAALEKASYEFFPPDFQKYNQKLRQLNFNLKQNELLARRFLKGELEPSKILSMSPFELKEGLTAEETARKEPDESEGMQMVDSRCSRCSELKVGVREIIQAGHVDRYQLECIACGHAWYASRDDVASLSFSDPSSIKNVGTAPLATTKFENVEKNLVSPRESDKAINDTVKKTSELVLESQKSFSKTKEDNPDTPKTATKNGE
ncbi:hypothetical protein UlMin_002251 [Ulmus minor]